MPPSGNLKGHAMTYEETGVFMESSELEAYAGALSRKLKPDGECIGRSEAALLRRDLKLLRVAEKTLESLQPLPGAARWLLDNAYLARREGLESLDAFAGIKRLPAAGGRARVVLLCTELIRCSRFELSEERLCLFLRGWQSFMPLSRRELELLGAGLRAGLVSELRELAQKLCKCAPRNVGENEIGTVISSLRNLEGLDFEKLITDFDTAEQLLMRDPAGIYPKMDRGSRAYYRQKLDRLAERHGISASRAAERVIKLSEDGEGICHHVGYWLLVSPLGGKRHQCSGLAYITLFVLLTLGTSVFAGFALESALASVLLLFPISELVKTLTDLILLRLLPRAKLPCLELENGIPDEGRTLCTVSAIVSDDDSARSLAESLEQARLISRDCGGNLLFAALADLPDTDSESEPRAEHALEMLGSAVDALNEKYGGGFFVLTRKRVFSGGRYMGWERKRGALLEAMLLLRGEESSLFCISGSADELENVSLLLALDSDTRLTPGCARRLVGAMLHPLNRPALDGKTHMVKSGHGIISPKISVSLPDAMRSDFSRVFAGNGGCGPYSGGNAELYMDMCSRGGFAGKGIIDIDAYLSCMAGRIPENRVLSHDTLEGACLRGGFMGEAEILEGFPRSPLSYYRRMHRWIRGDWQNFPWLLRRGRELPDIEKFRIFDNLRRSLLPIMTLAALCAGFIMPRGGLAAAAAVALITCLSQLLLTAAEGLFRDEKELCLRYHSKRLSGFGGGLATSAIKLILLPIQAQFCLDAAARALWRMLASHRHLLQWQTAGQSDKNQAGAAEIYASALPAALLGLALVLFSASIIGKAAGIIWLLSPACAFILGTPDEAAPPLSEPDCKYLLGQAEKMWRYFDEFMNAEENYLPPDNYQAQPPVGIAHRTSPTNIGLGLLSVISALELGLTDKKRALELVEACLETMEGLEKWHGHLYNWYDTRSLKPLKPAYVSTVDSGNLCACLIALKGALRAYGNAELAEKAEKLAAQMEFSRLFDRKRKLLYIGVEPESGKMASSWYDLMESEARLTAFIAIARGDVSAEMWRRLGRAQVQKNRYRGMVSWTGTMFEYLMPELLLPLYGGSLLHESAEFCLYVQKKRTAEFKCPWGISESAFYSLDPAMNYRYKAHGCAELALRREMDEELVISPYSSFLALCLRPDQAVKNLRRLEELGADGSFGMWEAVDFSHALTGRKQADTVRCVMAHHLGMSMTSAANCLTGGKLRDYFMADAAMSAFSCLLQESIPEGGRLLRRRADGLAEKKRPNFSGSWERSGISQYDRLPECGLLAGMAYSLVLTETGISIPAWGQILPYLTGELCTFGHGIDIFLRLGAKRMSLLPERGGEYSWSFTPETARICADLDGFRTQITASVAKDEPAELRRITIWKKSGAGFPEEPASLEFSFSPILTPERDYRAHPAFAKLGLSAKIHDGALVIRRLARGRAKEMYMCLACDAPAVFCSAPGAGTARASAPVQLHEKELFLVEPRIECSVPIEPESSEEHSVCFAIFMAGTEHDAVSGARRCLYSEELEPGDMPRRAAAVIGMSREDFDGAMSILPFLCFPTPPQAGEGHERGELWKHGISGDLPIVCADFTDESLLANAVKLMDRHLLLCGCGISFDLVLISNDSAGYRRPLNSALEHALWRNGGDALSSAPGGVHVVDNASGAQGIRACAAAAVDLADEKTALQRPFAPEMLSLPEACGGTAPEYFWDEDGSFVLDTDVLLPKRMWTDILTNGRMSFVAADCGSGGMWYMNSRENPIVPWLGQPLSVTGPEKLELEAKGKTTSLFAGQARCRVRFGFGFCVWESRTDFGDVSVTAFIPPEKDVRVLIIEPRGDIGDAVLRWRLELLLAPEPKDSRYVETGEENGILSASNQRSTDLGRPFSALSCPGAEAFTCCAASREYDRKTGLAAQSVFDMRIRLHGACVIVCGCESGEVLRELAAPEAAAFELEKTKAWWRGAICALSLSSPSVELNRLMNGWAAYQALACRVMARGSIYQSGGAYGFRDQLQDTINLIPFSQKPARGQILRSCGRQYVQGDVQHWWHEGLKEARGVRTRCSDDLLWLVWALCEYVEKTGDMSICFEKQPYLSSAELSPEENDRYEAAETTDYCETVLTHCRRALDRVLERGTGGHGLLLIGNGDWNDGFDAVRGESQWLTWFFCAVAPRYASIAEKIEPGIGRKYREAAKTLLRSAEKSWNGEWYVRGYYADGQPLGAAGSEECEIDSIAQSFAAFCPGTEAKRVKVALQSAYERLYDRKNQLVKLFDPPFSGAGRSPGYINSYGPGFRENGGQYTHGAVWLASALLQSGMIDEGWEIIRTLLPGGKSAEIYRGEPFVVPADIYSAPGHAGEAGWTWYTGSAGWLLRVVTEDLLGLHLKNGELEIRPRLPSDWSGYSAIFCGKRIAVSRNGITVDGKSCSGENVRL